MASSEYKKTEAGLIPSDWDVKHLDDFGNIVSGGTPSTKEPSYWNGLIAWCTPTDITSTPGTTITETEKSITEDGLRNSAAIILPEGSLLLCTRATIGDSKINTVPMATNQGFKNIVPNKYTCIKYLYYLLQTKKKTMLEKATASTFAEISKSALCEIPLQVPDTQEQEKIAEVLSDVDALISNLQKLIQKYKNIKQGCLQQLLPQIDKDKPRLRLPGYTEAWHKRKLGDRTSIKARIGWQKLTKGEYLEVGDYYLITGTDITENHRIDYRKCFYVTKERYEKDDNIKVHNGDIIVTKDGTIGKVARIDNLDKPATLNSHLFVVRDLSGTLNNRFLLHVLSSKIFTDFVEETKTGTTLTGLPQKAFIQFEFEAPSLQEQEEISNFLDELDDNIFVHQRKLEKFELIKQGMMEELLTGKVRLI